MSDKQAGKSEKAPSGRRMALIGGGATALAVINMSTGSEAQSTPVLILENLGLAGGLLGLVGGLIMMMTKRP
ncbi:MAG TPA: hypothetical protein VKX28_17335 [Xanthobacteraceae bacterium]|jgi:hypothetical protein|nr:hypothetical protein [Xanthobacteraceae bacterium]